MRCINSMPEIVVAALLNRLKPSITFVLDLMLRWKETERLEKLFELYPKMTAVAAKAKPATKATTGKKT
ncbi:MAG: hypothetical protein JWQ50_850 [Caballeronia mineralivorans]|jgi:hypothetical protein|nr:hypothetical protein [Caballeronia mineralivorans]